MKQAVVFSLGNRRHSLLRSSNRLGRVLVILQPAREVGIVGSHVKVAVTGQVEENDALFSRLFGFQGLVYRSPDGMSRFWRWHNAFAARELYRCLEDRVLVIGLGIDDAL